MKHFGKMVLRTGLAAMALGMAGSAQATLLNFNLARDNNSLHLSWQLDSNPVPDLLYDGGYVGFVVYNIPTYLNGMLYSSNINFSSLSSGGGVGSSLGVGPQGPQLYIGSESAPTILIGNYALSDGTAWNLSISAANISPTVPEPATWGMMLVGFGLVGGAMRRGRVVRPRLA
jgi:hypothetical protein